MKAALRIRAYAQALQQGKDSDSPYYKMSGMRTLIADLEEVLLSRKEYRRRARAEHKAAQSLLAELVQVQAENTELKKIIRTVASSAGVQKIFEARAYQKRRYADGQTHDAVPTQTPELLRAALSLLTNTPELYPFGNGSFEGILRHGGRKAQLAHAGACIAALIDLLPSPVQPGTEYRLSPEYLRQQKDRAAYLGEEGDLL